MSDRYVDAIFQAVEKFKHAAQIAAEQNIIPYGSKGGQFITSPYDGNSWWTGGFWSGIMWQLYAIMHYPEFLTEARRVERLLTDEMRNFLLLNHDVGFMYLLSCGADQKITGNRQAGVDTLHAASLLMGRFNPVGFIRAWNNPQQRGFAIIDSMMNLPLLFRATRLTGDPRFSNVAIAHADTTLREFMRPDGSLCHIVEFDPFTGKRLREHAGQGYARGSSWSRGQAWGLYGFTLAFINTREIRFLRAAQRIADRFISHIRPDGLVDCDFDQPKEIERIDNIAGSVAACALFELYFREHQRDYLDAALRLLDGMLNYCCDWSDASLGILTHCTASYHDDTAGVHTNIAYGDFFFLEALAKRCGNDPMLWI